MVELPPLPYAHDALEPYMSAQTLSVHHGKHHKAYVETTNKLIKGTEFESLALEQIIRRSAKDKAQKKLFNNAAQVWNHNFFWQSMYPRGGGAPAGKLARHIESDFGSFAAFAEDFEKQGTDIFGTGWLWLVLSQGKLKLLATEDADNPLLHNAAALLCADVWEHAYYLDYQNKRPEFLKTFVNKLANWDFAARNLAAATAKAA